MNTPTSITRREALSRLSLGTLRTYGLWPPVRCAPTMSAVAQSSNS